MEGKEVRGEQGATEQRKLAKPYPNPPLVEALCEFRFAGGPAWDGTVPGLVYTRLRDQFPRSRTVRDVEVQLTTSDKGAEQIVRPVERVQLLQHDERAIVQIGPDLLVVKCLRPYPSWERFSQMIGRALDAYREEAKPAKLAMIGLRYINRIELAADAVDLEAYFEFRPFLGPELPQDIDSFIVGVTIPYEGGRDRLRMELTSASASRGGGLAFRLDLLYSLVRGGAVLLDDALEWADAAHERIEQAFERAITDKLRQKFLQRSE
ncbi:TIGR04255 family protein [Candidatus Bipolaricaulota bacterium]|nr:TIGR04255 family protein [Candidatus Bipolaricaulota bacterium]